MTRGERLLLACVAAAAWSGLLLQAHVSFTFMLGNGVALSDALIRFFSYFTVLTNAFIALESTAFLFLGGGGWHRSFVRSSVATGLAVSIFYLALCYIVLLRNLQHLTGSAELATTLLHYAVPSIFLIYWGLYASRHKLPWRHAALWVLYPFFYFVYLLIEGARTGLYPYPFIDVARDGYPHVLRNGAILLLGYWLGGLAFIAVGRYLQRPESWEETMPRAAAR